MPTALIGFVANRAHHADIGSDTPGSMPLATHLDEEGLVISPVKVMRNNEASVEFEEVGFSVAADFANSSAENFGLSSAFAP